MPRGGGFFRGGGASRGGGGTAGGREVFHGMFGSYTAKGAARGGDTDDETAIESAIDEMMGMTGNPGQEAIIGNGWSAFWDWAMDALEAEFGYAGYDEAIIADIGADAYSGTWDIWGHGYYLISNQSAYHDGFDENGEGTGEEF